VDAGDGRAAGGCGRQAARRRTADGIQGHADGDCQHRRGLLRRNGCEHGRLAQTRRPGHVRREEVREGSSRTGRYLAFVMLLVLLLALQNPGPELYYSVTVPTYRSAYLVEVQITNPPSPSRLVIPSWAPGAYRLMDSWQNIRDVAAVS